MLLETACKASFFSILEKGVALRVNVDARCMPAHLQRKTVAVIAAKLAVFSQIAARGCIKDYGRQIDTRRGFFCHD